MKKIISILILLIASVFLIYFLSGNKEDNRDWIGFYYPDISNLSEFIKSEPLNSKLDCLDWIDYQSYNNKMQWDYECGYKCNYNHSLGLDVCKRTEQ